MIYRILLLLCILGSPLASFAQTKKIIPEDWLPALAPAIKTSLTNLRAAESQAEMNSLSRNVADMTDAQLFIAYVRLYEKLPPKQRETLLAEQSAWLEKRPAVAKKGIESKGGSLAPLEANNAELTYTEKRLAELRARLKNLTTKKNSASDDD